RLRLCRAGEHRQVGLPVRRRDEDRARPREAPAERLPRFARRAGLQRVHRRAVREEDARQGAHAAFFTRPSSCIASCTFGRAPTRLWYAARFGHRARSMPVGLVQLSSTKRYASATVKALPIRYSLPASCCSIQSKREARFCFTIGL